MFRLPLILSDNRALGPIAGGGANTYPQLLADPAGGALFNVPFKSPTRSGVDFFCVGLDWAHLQPAARLDEADLARRGQGRFGVGTPLHACNANAPRPAAMPRSDAAGRRPASHRPDPRPGHQPRDGRSSRSTRTSRAASGTSSRTRASRRSPSSRREAATSARRTTRRGSSSTIRPYLGTFLAGARGHPLGAARAVPAPRGRSSALPGRTTRPGANTRSSSTRSARRMRPRCASPNPTGVRRGAERGRASATYGGSPTPSNRPESTSTGSPISRPSGASRSTGRRRGRRASTSSSSRGLGHHVQPGAPHHRRRRLQPEPERARTRPVRACRSRGPTSRFRPAPPTRTTAT